MAWDESKHPRHPAGVTEGGQFAPKGAGGTPTKDDQKPEVDEAVVENEARKAAKLAEKTDSEGLYRDPVTKEWDERRVKEVHEPLKKFLKTHRWDDETDQWVEHEFTPVEEGETPWVGMFGGGSGSGKTMLEEQAFKACPQPDNLPIVNSDQIKTLLPEWNDMINGPHPENAAKFLHEESSYLSKQLAEEFINDRYNLLLDGTGDSSFDKLKAKIDRINGDADVPVHAYYCTTDAEEACKRSFFRALSNPQRSMVPHTVIFGNHREVSYIFPEATGISREDPASSLWESWELWDNNGAKGEHFVIARGNKMSIEIYHEQAWNQFLEKQNRATPTASEIRVMYERWEREYRERKK